jgi:acyl-coenzyme A thioesterase PaaI-like protein
MPESAESAAPDERPRPPPPREHLDAYAEAFNTTLKALSATLTFPDPPDRVLVRVDPVLPLHRGGLGTSAINGGVLAALFDLVIGSTPALLDPTRRTATLQLSMSFERPVTGDWFTAEGWIDRAGTGTIFSSAVIKDAQGVVCSRCTGLVKLSQKPWVEGWKLGS